MKLSRARQTILQLEAEKDDYIKAKKLEEISVKKVAEQVSNDRTIQYISRLELEQENLRKQLRDLSVQLQQSKVANASLQRKVSKQENNRVSKI